MKLELDTTRPSFLLKLMPMLHITQDSLMEDSRKLEIQTLFSTFDRIVIICLNLWDIIFNVFRFDQIFTSFIFVEWAGYF